MGSYLEIKFFGKEGKKAILMDGFFIQSTVKPRPSGRGYKARFFN